MDERRRIEGERREKASMEEWSVVRVRGEVWRSRGSELRVAPRIVLRVMRRPIVAGGGCVAEGEETGIAVGWGVERDESGGGSGTEGCRMEAEAVRGGW
ncbi:MAG: hypothetical protein QXQ53_08420 [Candidatus Methanosuratincola sp.]